MAPGVPSQPNLSTFEADVREIVSAQHVRTAEATDAVCEVRPSLLVEPGTEQDLAKVLKLASAAGLAVIPRGGGSKLEWGNAPRRADVIVSLGRLNRVLEHAWADLTVNVQAGCTIAELQETLAKHGQQLALDALWPERATVGGVLSTNDSGALRLRFGSLRDLVIGATVALADGTLASSGGRVVKNVAGYDLPKLVTGALGTLGVITRAFFRLHPLPRQRRTISCVTPSVSEAQRLVLSIQNSTLAHTGLQIYCGAMNPVRVDVLFEGTEAGLAAQVDQVKLLMEAAAISEGSGEEWNAREKLFGPGATDKFAVAKFAALPAKIAETIELVAQFFTNWQIVAQATGIGWLRVDGETASIESALRGIRAELESRGGSLTVLRRPAEMALDAWGSAGDALGVMKAVKRQFDARDTLNPGRFIGGI